MKLLRESLLLRALSRLLAGRRVVARRAAYVVTVPAPLARPAGSNVIELHRRSPVASGHASTPAQADELPSSVPLALASSR